MDKVLIDLSVWIDYFRMRNSKVEQKVEDLLDRQRIVLCGIVELEILQGLRKEERTQVEELFQLLSYVDTSRQDFINAGNKLAELRCRGITIPPSDCIIATLCLRHHFMLLSFDKHFDYLAEIRRYYIYSRSTIK